MNYVPATSSTLSGLSAVGLRRLMWERKMREDSVLPSVFESLKTAVKVQDDEMIVDKSGIFMDISGIDAKDGQSVRLALSTPLAKAPQFGTSQDMIGNEDEAKLLWTELFYNEIKKSVKFNKWGYDYNDTEYLGWVESYGPKITTFFGELRDTRIHQALLLRRAEELINDPLDLPQQFNPNWFIPNLDDSSFPVWDKVNPTVTNGAADAYGYYSARSYGGSTAFSENIAVALLAASGTGSTPKNTLSVSAMYALSTYAPDKVQCPPIMMDGRPTYILLMPPRVKAKWLDPTITTSLGAYWENVGQYIDKDREILPGEIGCLCGNIVVIEDYRLPTLTVGGSSGAYTLTPGFLWPGNNDERNQSNWSNTSGSTNYVFDMCMLLGENAIAEYTADPLVTNLKEQTEYTKRQGRGAYLGQGIQIPFWDLDAASQLDGSSKTLIYRSSIMIPVGRLARMTVS